MIDVKNIDLNKIRSLALSDADLKLEREFEAKAQRMITDNIEWFPEVIFDKVRSQRQHRI